MNDQRPEYLRPALIAGVVAGILSGLPFIAAGNCICCLWILGGAAVAARMLAMATPARLTAGDGAVVGALTGIVAAIVRAIVSIPFRPLEIRLTQRLLDWLSSLGGQVPPQLNDVVNQSGGALTTGWFLIGLLVSAAVFAVMGVLGGIIGVSLFGRKALPPAAVPPGPAAPAPPPPSGPPVP